MRGNIKLDNPERFLNHFRIEDKKLDDAIGRALTKLKSKITYYGEKFPTPFTKNLRYLHGENANWVCGLFTGCYNLAYELSGDNEFLSFLKKHMESYKYRADNKIELGDHDVGFIYSPSCVAYYNITDDKSIKELALKAAEILYDESYTEKGGFILRWGVAGKTTDPKNILYCRTMMDTMLNIPLFFWATKETGDEKYLKAALSQCDITDKYLIRLDGSTYHHYQFEQGTYKPLHGVTCQGNRDESTWSRGHSWGILGYPIAYGYSKEEYMIDLQRDLTFYCLNHLPVDNIPYWDYDFVSGDEPRDTSAGAIAACGMLEMAKYLSDNDQVKEIYLNAANMMIDAIIDNYSYDEADEFDGLIKGVTPARRMAQFETDACGVYGDYFYLEALMRLKNPAWKMYW